MARTVTRYCRGTSATCSGAIDNGDWEGEESCSAAEVSGTYVVPISSAVASRAAATSTRQPALLVGDPCDQHHGVRKIGHLLRRGRVGRVHRLGVAIHRRAHHVASRLSGCESGPVAESSECEMTPSNCTDACSGVNDCLASEEGDGPSNGYRTAPIMRVACVAGRRYPRGQKGGFDPFRSFTTWGGTASRVEARQSCPRCGV